MIHLAGPYAVAALLIGIGTYGILARRNAVLVLIGVELVINGAGLLLVATGAVGSDTLAAGGVLTLFVITIAAAEVCVALAVVLALFRMRGGIDLTSTDQASADQASADQASADPPPSPPAASAASPVETS